MHKHHLFGCGLMLVAALAIFGFTGGSTGGLGLVLVALLCPITMGAVMWFLMGSQHRPTDHDPEQPSASARSKITI